MNHYSPVNYYTPGWVYPRGRFRETFPRYRKRFNPNLLVPGGTQIIPVTHPFWYFSPYNWWTNGAGTLLATNTLPNSSLAISRDCGAYNKFTVISGGAGTYTLRLDTTGLQTVAGTGLPYIAWTLDGQLYATAQLSYQAGVFRVPLANNLPAGTHTFRIIYLRNLTASTPDAWGLSTGLPLQSVRITGLEIDGGSSMTPQFIRPNLALFYGDSELAGFAAPFDASTSWAENVAYGLNAEYGIVSAPGQGWQFAGLGGVPQFWTLGNAAAGTWQFYFSGQSRLVAGQLSPLPNTICVALGTNDGFHGASAANVQSSQTPAFTAIRAAAPGALLCDCIPPYQWYAGYISAGFANYVSSTGDGSATLLNGGTEIVAYFDSANPGSQGLMGDDAHPSQRGHAVLTGLYMQQIQAARGTTSSTVVLPGRRVPYRVPVYTPSRRASGGLLQSIVNNSNPIFVQKRTVR